jgi:hypothetical protein
MDRRQRLEGEEVVLVNRLHMSHIREKEKEKEKGKDE